jgi:hypothetical protein
VVFKHIGLDYGDITRPATVGGGVRLARPVAEVHEVENPNDSPSEFLRVEFKDLPADAGQIRGKFLPEPHAPAANFSKVLFENGALLIKRRACLPLKLAAGEACAGREVRIYICRYVCLCDRCRCQ